MNSYFRKFRPAIVHARISLTLTYNCHITRFRHVVFVGLEVFICSWIDNIQFSRPRVYFCPNDGFAVIIICWGAKEVAFHCNGATYHHLCKGWRLGHRPGCNISCCKRTFKNGLGCMSLSVK